MHDKLKNIYRKIKKLKRKLLFSIRYAIANEVVDIPYEEAKRKLNELAPMPTSTAVMSHEIGAFLYDLTIIVPAYNAEKWIRQCVDSILGQETNYHFLAIVIDDGSKDETGEILDSYLPNERLKVIHQENKGYSGARNVALQNLQSEYIMFVDSDDFLLSGAVEYLMSTAYQEKADIVEGNGYRFDENGRIGTIKKSDADIWGGPCLKVIRSKLFEKVEFPEGYLYEDTIICSLIVPMASSVITIPNEIYAYRIHVGSITQSHDQNMKRIDSLWIMLLMEENRKELGIPKEDKYFREMLHHTVFTYRRTKLLPIEVKKLIFAVTCGFIHEYFGETHSENKEYKKLVNALEKKCYGKYSVFCKYFG